MNNFCPPFYTVLTNIYRKNTELFLGLNSLQSCEGITQGDPLAMPFYVLATRPLMNALRMVTPEVKQVWYADDATAAGKVVDLKSWWSKLSAVGPSYGYFVNPSKTWLVTKDGYSGLASEYFGDTNVNITSHGRPILGSPIGTPEYISSFVEHKVQEWVKELDYLSMFADSQPHAAYSALTHGLYSKWNYLARKTPDIEHSLLSLEDFIRMKLFPKLTGREPPNDQERCLFALPTRVGGLNLINSAAFSDTQYQDSVKVTGPLTESILDQSKEYSYEVLSQQLSAKKVPKTKTQTL